tara:strand:+ start:3484 stop:3783 length:300 start_codon:yes stop_codon:yes gene_type:complete
VLASSYYNLKKLLLLSKNLIQFEMKKLLPIIIALITLNSCISLKFPDSINVEITVPEDADIEKIEIMIDTLKAQAKDHNLKLEASIQKSNKKKQKKKNK